MSDLIGKVGTNYTGINEAVHVTKVLKETYETKEEALAAAKANSGSELVYQEQESGKWKVGELKEKGWYSGKDFDLSTRDKSNIKIESYAMARGGVAQSEISFLEDDDMYVLKQLSRDRNSNVRMNVATRTDLPEDFYMAMAKDNNTRIQTAIARNPSTPTEALQYLAKFGRNIAQRSLVFNEEARNNPEIKQALSKSRYSSVRELMALPEEQLNQLAQNFNQQMENYNTDYSRFAALYDLAHDGVSDVREELAQRIDLPSEIYVELAHDGVSNVREELASNPYTSIEALRILVNDGVSDVREAVAKHPLSHLDPYIMHELANDGVSNVREAFARGPRLELPYDFIPVPFDPFNPYSFPGMNLQNNGIQQGDNTIQIGDTVNGDQYNINAQQVIIQQNND